MTNQDKELWKDFVTYLLFMLCAVCLGMVIASSSDWRSSKARKCATACHAEGPHGEHNASRYTEWNGCECSDVTWTQAKPVRD